MSTQAKRGLVPECETDESQDASDQQGAVSGHYNGQENIAELRQQVQQENHEHWLLEVQASTSASSRGPTPEPFHTTQETRRLDSEPFQLLYGYPVRELPDSVVPKEILTDQGTNITSKLLKDIQLARNSRCQDQSLSSTDRWPCGNIQ